MRPQSACSLAAFCVAPLVAPFAATWLRPLGRAVGVPPALTTLALTLAGVTPALILPAAAQQPACRSEPVGAATVVAVRDGRTVLLGDGREARLAAIETPLPGEPGAAAARAALAELVAGRIVTLRSAGPDGAAPAQDRYGRTLVHAAVEGRPVEESLLASGHARVSAQAGLAGCIASLLAQERAARAARRGLWADGTFGPPDAAAVADIAGLRGRFTVVEGTVLSVRESRGVIYMNFARRWSRGFTVTILKRNARAFVDAGIDPKALEGRRVRVRGFVEQRQGPVIEATRPEQIELAGLN